MADLLNKSIFATQSDIEQAVSDFLASGPIQDADVKFIRQTVDANGVYCVTIFYTA